MSKIRILGADYKAAYESARHIIESGMLSEEMPGCYIDSSGCIHNGNNSFEFIDGSAFHNDINESDFKMTEDGANWFSSIRNPLDADEANLLSQGTHLWEASSFPSNPNAKNTATSMSTNAMTFSICSDAVMY